MSIVFVLYGISELVGWRPWAPSGPRCSRWLELQQTSSERHGCDGQRCRRLVWAPIAEIDWYSRRTGRPSRPRRQPSSRTRSGTRCCSPPEHLRSHSVRLSTDDHYIDFKQCQSQQVSLRDLDFGPIRIGLSIAWSMSHWWYTLKNSRRYVIDFL